MAKCGNSEIFWLEHAYDKQVTKLYFTLENIFVYKYYHILEQITECISFEIEFMYYTNRG